jgi:Carboxypeptidase regulatory-like domain
MQRNLFKLILSVALSLLLISCVTAVGQVLKGSISGTVTDPQGAVISNAQVKATNVATGAELTTTTDNAGAFRFNLIPTGKYKVDINAPGFKSLTQTDIPVTAGQDAGLGSLKLSVGDTGTTVEVTAETPMIESTQAQVTNTFSSDTLTTFAGLQENEGLDNLALFVPGVSSSRDNNFSNFNGGLGFSVNGLRGRNNDQQIDGQNNNDNSVAGPGVFVTDPEWVSQYVIVTSNFGPEYGRNAGSVVNILSKGGGNAWHGSVYGNYSNSIFNAMTNFQKNFDTDARGNRLTDPPTLNDTFSGIQVGGPVIKNRVFVAGGFNNQIINVSNPFTSGGNTPTPNGLATLAGCFPTGPGAQSLAALQTFGPFGVKGGSPTASNLDVALTSADPNFVTGCPGVEFGNVTRTLRTNFHAYNFYGRTDVQWSRDTVVGRYLYNKSTFFNVDDGTFGNSLGYPFNEPALGQTALLSWTHNFTTHMVNELRGAYSRLNVEFGGNNIGNTVPPAGQLNQAPAQITFSTGANSGFGPANNLPQQRIVNTWQIQDNWNYNMGRHTLKAGFNWTYQRSPNIFLPIINGTFRFSNWASFFANTPNRVRVANGPSSLDFREYDTFGYVGDDWKIGRNLTVNLGLTYTYYGQPANLFNDITTKRESNPATAFWNPAVPFAARTFPKIDTRTNSFGPSIGFAYAPQGGGILGGGKTVIRGGYRYLYDPPYYNIYLNIATSAPEVFLQSFTGSSAHTKPLPAVATGPVVRAQLSPFLQTGVFDPRTLAQTNVPTNFGPDKVHSWSLGVEREIRKNQAIEARYVGNKAYNLFQSIDGNPFIADLQSSFPQFVPPGLTPCPASIQIGPGAGTDVGRRICGPGVLRTRANSGFSNYNGVQVEYRANNIFKQLSFRTGYTYSKTLDNVSEIFSTGLAGNTIAFPQNPVSPQNGEYSFSGLDYPHTWSLIITEQLPFYRDQHGVAGHILGGWTISANYLLQSGQRYTPAQLSEVAASTSSGNFFDAAFVAAFVGFDTARPFFGNKRAPVTSVGAFAGDACFIFGITGSEPVCTISPTQLISVNALNQPGGLSTVVPVSANQVRFIINGGSAESVFGTPFGNVPRNPLQDAMTNIGNLSVSKRFRLTERASFEFRTTAINVLNHPNFLSIDPFLEDGGLFAAGTGFGNPLVTDTVPGQVNFPVSASRRLIFGGTIRF